MVVRIVITLLCGVGLYASLFMLAKSRRAERGELSGPSVVQTPRARLYGVPNALLGAIYYPSVALAVWLARGPRESAVLLAAVLFAALTSAALGYSLLFVTRRPCPYCWTSHAVNWSLLALCGWIFLPNVLSRGI
ncbi:MAG TPA: vitamin K epoxide reductase family protein [Candidatus Binatia bacterium]|nr:vitamin K epoxide reductase family protein [Candidatus Binatia bacterium]